MPNHHPESDPMSSDTQPQSLEEFALRLRAGLEAQVDPSAEWFRHLLLDLVKRGHEHAEELRHPAASGHAENLRPEGVSAEEMIGRAMALISGWSALAGRLESWLLQSTRATQGELVGDPDLARIAFEVDRWVRCLSVHLCQIERAIDQRR